MLQTAQNFFYTGYTEENTSPFYIKDEFQQIAYTDVESVTRVTRGQEYTNIKIRSEDKKKHKLIRKHTTKSRK